MSNSTLQKDVKSFKFALRQIWALCLKNIRLYFRKGPVLIFGLMFPLFMALTWVIGRDISTARLFTGIAAMAVFFTASAISPVILPWETREKGLERQITSPLSLSRIIWGIILASTLYSIVISGIVVFILGVLLGISFTSSLSFWGLLGGLCLMACVGSLMGLLISAPPTDQLPDIMTLANLIRFPLVFISGVFIPLHQLPTNMQVAAWFSPLTPFVDATANSIGEISILPLPIDLLILMGWFVAFYYLCMLFHSRTFEKRFIQVSGPMR